MEITKLTQNDSKILGTSKERYERAKTSTIQTNKYRALNSAWTPLANSQANKTLFEDRTELCCNWFDLWSDKQRKQFLFAILSRCRPSQLYFIQGFFEYSGIAEHRDFTQVLPKNLSLKILSYLSPKDLCRCAQVSSHWKYLSESNDLWMSKCLNFGWFLPYKPYVQEYAAWKFHYIDCVKSINAKPLDKVFFNYFCDSLENK
jgi:hypothetical protein